MNRALAFKAKGWEDYLYWQTSDRKMLKKINRLIADIDRNGHEGIGKPEPLKHQYQGWWSRRINDEHRLIYRIEGREVQIASCRHHYGD
ncbi:MAG: Txe/YoeB family addiction module toxin [Oscillospiraceae bacterium]|nr:Txe/YoeB family addiction module toxin [Oscillospiraceae bacterium]